MIETRAPLNLLIDIQKWKELTQTLSAAERGAFLSMKMFVWRAGPIPDSDRAIAQIAGMELKEWKKARKVLEPMFIVSGGEWFRTDWNEELEEAYRAVAKAKEKGKNAITARWDRKKRGETPYSENTPSIPQVFPVNTPAILNNKDNPPSQEKEFFDYNDPEIDRLVSGHEARWKDQSIIAMAREGADHA
ncbi:DUF1376 domain-containing protein [Propionivibrio sp.]|uniref:DUF1376 domain-containing protein n=1 Tax=Propionivibrio sp. TaxID=2212460 RepID=UPI002635DFC6|nr:DUF1376 domain-containing protein [Propionivibrio sp.]